MKTSRHSLLFLLLVSLGIVSLASAIAAPILDVKVSSSGGKVVYKGTTDASGAFATPKLPSGNYTVQFNTVERLKGGPFALVLSAGKETTGSDAVPAGKFLKGGVAMKITVSGPASLTGKVGPAGSMAKTPMAKTPAASTKNGAKTKMINGHEFVWIPPEQGDWNPGKWVEADSIEAKNALARAHAKEMPGGQ